MKKSLKEQREDIVHWFNNLEDKFPLSQSQCTEIRSNAWNLEHLSLQINGHDKKNTYFNIQEEIFLLSIVQDLCTAKDSFFIEDIEHKVVFNLPPKRSPLFRKSMIRFLFRRLTKQERKTLLKELEYESLF